MTQIKLGLKLRELREERGVSKKEVARVMGVSKYKYAKIERGKAIFYLGQGVELAKYYVISLDNFVGD